MEDKYITVATYTNTSEANINREKLKLRGIEAFVSEGHALLEPIGQNNNENARLNIKASDYELAMEILNVLK